MNDSSPPKTVIFSLRKHWRSSIKAPPHARVIMNSQWKLFVGCVPPLRRLLSWHLKKNNQPVGNFQNITVFKKPKQPGAAAVCAAQPLVLRVVFVIFISFRVCRGLFNNWINYIDIVEYPPLIVIRDGGDDKSVCQPPSRSRSPRTHLLALSLSLWTHGRVEQCHMKPS